MFDFIYNESIIIIQLNKKPMKIYTLKIEGNTSFIYANEKDLDNLDLKGIEYEVIETKEV